VSQSLETSYKPVPVQRFTWILFIAWTLFILGLSWQEINAIRLMTRELAISEAISYFSQDRALRRWSASHGGVYVPVDERTQPSPYLAHLPDRDIVTPSGKKLTLMNPAFMLRQISEEFSSLYDCMAKITSLNPLRGENGPDEWERRALVEFRQGSKKKMEFTKMDGLPFLRYMEPVVAQRECLECHGPQGYKEGGISGGISIALPMVRPLAIQAKQVKALFYGVFSVWLIGVIGIWFGGRILRRHVDERDQSQKKLQLSRDNLARKTEDLAAANVALNQEIVIRKEAQLEILRSEEKFRTLADFTYDWEYWVDQVGDYVYVSPSCERITGYSPEEFIENPELLLKIVSDEHKAMVKDHIISHRNNQEVCEFEFAIVTKDNEMRWISHICQPVFNDAGIFLGRRASNRDITDRKGAELALEKFASDLANSNKDLKDFAYMASHDLREPMVLIQAFSERLLKHCGADLSERGREYLNRIFASSSRMQMLINDILAYSRVTTNGQKVEDVELDKILGEVVDDLEMRINETGGAVHIDVEDRIKADPAQIRQLFQNLVANALKYHRPDVAPMVKVYSTNFTVHEEGGMHEYCKITVEDNGIGFDQKLASQIFGLFQRLHAHNHYEGTGIGLAVCKRIVERHGGVVTVGSKPGVGSTFVVSLPLKGPADTER
jgi:PAS domain S-box-containing protein